MQHVVHGAQLGTCIETISQFFSKLAAPTMSSSSSSECYVRGKPRKNNVINITPQQARVPTPNYCLCLAVEVPAVNLRAWTEMEMNIAQLSLAATSCVKSRCLKTMWSGEHSVFELKGTRH
jgi:hypothetical protein